METPAEAPVETPAEAPAATSVVDITDVTFTEEDISTSADICGQLSDEQKDSMVLAFRGCLNLRQFSKETVAAISKLKLRCEQRPPMTLVAEAMGIIDALSDGQVCCLVIELSM